MKLRPCPKCQRHCRAEETACPFCTASLPQVHGERAALGHLSRSALVAIATTGAASALAGAGCSDSGTSNEGTTDAGFAGSLEDARLDVRAADAYGGPPLRTTCTPPASTPPYEPATPAPPPADWGRDVCTNAALQGFVDACLGSAATLAACTQWRQSNATCATCLVTPEATSPRTMFTTSATVTPNDANPLGLPTKWVADTVGACLDHFAIGCGEKYFTLKSCVDAACNDETNCRTASAAELDTCQDDAIGGGSGVCGAPALVALGTNGACRGAFPVDGGTAPSGQDCFSQAGEDTSTDAGRRAFFVRIGGYFCGRP